MIFSCRELELLTSAMKSGSFNLPLLTPKTLKTLACNLKHSGGNTLLHKLVLDSSDPNASVNELNINAILLSMSDLPADTVNALNAEGLSALHLAVIKNNLFIVKKLLSCLVNININICCYEEGSTALHYAAKFGHLSIIREFLDREDDVKTCNKRCLTPAEFAVKNGNLEALKTFVGNGVDMSEGEALLYQAALWGRLNIIKFLIEKGVNVDFKSEVVNNLVRAAARSGDVKTVEFFVVNGVDVNASSYPSHKTPLHTAAMKGKVEVAEFLLSSGADVNCEDDLNWTPLVFAIQQINVEMTEMLVKNGADVNIKDIFENTPLYWAEAADNLQIIEFLVRNGADVGSRND